MNIIKATAILLSSVFFVLKSNAQFFNDWEARPHISAEYRFNKRLSLEGTYYMYIDKNISAYDKSVIAGEVGYKLTKWLKAGLEYRYGIAPKKNYNEMRYSLTFDHKLGDRWKVKYRPMFQQDFVSLEKEELKMNPMEYFIRNRLTLSYDLSDKFELFVFSENYQQIDHGNWNFHKQKSAGGVKFAINQQNSVGMALYVINKKSGKNTGRLDFGYTYSFGYKKK